MAFEKYILPNSNEDTKLNIHLFRAILHEKIVGEKNNSECLAAIEEQLGVSLTSNEISDLQILLAAINSEITIPGKMAVVDEWYRVFVIAESGVSWYNTRAKIKARLVFNDD